MRSLQEKCMKNDTSDRRWPKTWTKNIYYQTVQKCYKRITSDQTFLMHRLYHFYISVQFISDESLVNFNVNDEQTQTEKRHFCLSEKISK